MPANAKNVEIILKRYTREEIVEMVRQFKAQQHYQTQQAIKTYQTVQNIDQEVERVDRKCIA